MGWIGLGTGEDGVFDLRGLNRGPQARPRVAPQEALLSRGSLVIEFRQPHGARPRTLLYHYSAGDWPMSLGLRTVPGGGLSLVVEQSGRIGHALFVLESSFGKQDELRLTFSWDAPGAWARLAVEDVRSSAFQLQDMQSVAPLPVDGLRSLVDPHSERYLSPDVTFLAVSREVEPVGPLPGLSGDTPVATPHGYVPLRTLRRGDTVLDQNGQAQPVLQAVSRTVPARGRFAPVLLRAPYFGLQRDVVAAPAQQVMIAGSDVEYMFGREAVLARAGRLAKAVGSRPEATRLVTYHQVLLPRAVPIIAAGGWFESLFIGRLRRKKERMAATILAGYDRARLPEHAAPNYPQLHDYEALVLAERRSV